MKILDLQHCDYLSQSSCIDTHFAVSVKCFFEFSIFGFRIFEFRIIFGITFVALRPNFWRLLYGVRKVLDSPLHCILLWISFGFAKVRNYRSSLHKRRSNRYVRYDENRSDFRSSNDRFEVDFEHFEVHRHQCNT